MQNSNQKVLLFERDPSKPHQNGKTEASSDNMAEQIEILGRSDQEDLSVTETNQLNLIKTQNGRLRQNLRIINEFLSKAVVDQNLKRPTIKKESKDLSLREDTLKTEILNAQKQVGIYKRDLQILNKKVDREYRPEIVEKIKVDLVQKDQVIVKLNQENKTLQKIQREQSKALKDLYQEDIYKKQLQALALENKSIKEQLKIIKKNAPTLPVIIRGAVKEKNLQAQNLQTSREHQQETFQLKTDEDQKYLLMEKNLQIMYKIKKQQDTQLEVIHTKMRKVNDQNLSLNLQLVEKTKRINNLDNAVQYQYQKQIPTVSRVEQCRSRSSQRVHSQDQETYYLQPNILRKVVKVNHTPLKKITHNQKQNLKISLFQLTDSPISVREKRDKNFTRTDYPDQQQQNEKSTRSDGKNLSGNLNLEHQIIYDQHGIQISKSPEALQVLQVTPQSIRNLEKGTINQNNLKFFDKFMNHEEQIQKISQIKIWTDESNQIKGIQAFYITNHKKIWSGQIHGQIKDKNYLTQFTDLSSTDYLKKVNGCIGLNGNIGQYLEFLSVQNIQMKCGIQQMGQRKFQFETSEKEIPIYLFGSLNQKSNESFIASLGFGFVKLEGTL